MSGGTQKPFWKSSWKVLASTYSALHTVLWKYTNVLNTCSAGVVFGCVCVSEGEGERELAYVRMIRFVEVHRRAKHVVCILACVCTRA